MQSKLLMRLKSTHNAQSLHRTDEEAVQRMILALAIKDRRVHMQATQALIQAGTIAVQPLIKALADPDEQVWSLASAALLKIGEPAVPHLVAALEYPHECVRMYSAAILYKMETLEPQSSAWQLMRRQYSKLLAHQQGSPQRH